VYSTHVCLSVFEAPCSHPKACTCCAHVGQECDLANTPLPWQCLSGESADPCFMAAGSTQNAYTTRPFSPEDETCFRPCTTNGVTGILPIQSLFRFTGHTTEWDFLTAFSLCSIIFSARCVLYVRALEITVAALACNHTDRPRHMLQFLPQVTLSSVIRTTIQLLVS